MYVNVLVEINALEKLFTYSIPDNLNVSIGSRVKIPFGNRVIEGFVIEFLSNVDYEVKDIISIIDEEPLLNEEMLELGKYMSEIYLCPLISAYRAMLPSALKSKKSKVNIKSIKYVRLIRDGVVNKKSEENILMLLREKKQVKSSEIKNKEALKSLIEMNYLEEYEEEVYRLNTNTLISQKNELTSSQKEAFDSIYSSNESIYLLRGVTGSGKTEIYMELIEYELNKGKNALILVPEISITTQLINRFKKRFSDSIAVLHSSLSAGERYDEWRRIKKGLARIVIGARSAVFAPLTNIGVILIDEEHEDTYKQENSPRYSTIDIAIKRNEYYNSKLVLGSATPSLESYARAKVGKYKLVELTTRINKLDMPKVSIIDMKDEMKKGKSVLSSMAEEYIIDRLNKNEQIMILINRRGYSNYVMCNECGEVIKCHNCDITLTYHKSSDTLRCHYCGYATKLVNKCNKCGSSHIILKGSGTEKIEEFLINKFNNIRIVRMDSDTTSTKGSHERIINDFNNYKYDVLLGTQMIAKGLDFDNVTLVIILNADSSLYIPDYKSSENTFQLLTQASGRAGRKDKKGEIIIQTYNKEHYAIDLASKHDYVSFYNKEIMIRKKLVYPPFCFIVAIRILSSDYKSGLDTIGKIKDYLIKNLDSKYKVLGPSISIKINNIYKFQCIVKYKEKEDIYKVLEYISSHYRNTKYKLEIDFNPNRL